MFSPHKEESLAQTYSGVDSPNILVGMSHFNQSPPSTNNENLVYQPDRAEKMSVNEDLVTEQGKLKKERKHSKEQEETKDQEATERQEGAEKRGRSQNRHKSEKRDEGVTEGSEPSKSCLISKRISHKKSVPISLPTRSRGLSRSKSAVSRLKRETTQVPKDDKTKWMKCHQTAASLWKNVCRTARIVYDGASFALGLFVTYFLKYLVILVILMLLVTITHRGICEIPLVRHYHAPCTTVWVPTSLSTDAKQDHALSQLAEPMQRHTEFLNQLHKIIIFHIYLYVCMYLCQTRKLMKKKELDCYVL